jgi:hypothetical protein
MSLSAAQAADFVAEAKSTGLVWAIRDEGGYPAPMNAEGERAMPFWSKQSRAEKIIKTVPAYAGFNAEQIELEKFLDEWLSGLEEDGLSVGLNWYGKRVTGYHLTPANVRARFEWSKTGQRRTSSSLAPPRPGKSMFAKFVAWVASKSSAP